MADTVNTVGTHVVVPLRPWYASKILWVSIADLLFAVLKAFDDPSAKGNYVHAAFAAIILFLRLRGPDIVKQLIQE